MIMNTRQAQNASKRSMGLRAVEVIICMITPDFDQRDID